MNKTKGQKAITLVALIITIIVLLILAVVAIRAVNDGGIIWHAQNAKSEYEIAQEKENVYLAAHQAFIIGNGKIEISGLTSALNSQIGAKGDKWEYSDDTTNPTEWVIVEILSSNREYKIYMNGKVEGPLGSNPGGNEPGGDVPGDMPATEEFAVSVSKEYDDEDNNVKLTITANVVPNILPERVAANIVAAKEGLSLDSSENPLEELLKEYYNKAYGTSLTYQQIFDQHSDNFKEKTVYGAFEFCMTQANIECNTVQEWALSKCTPTLTLLVNENTITINPEKPPEGIKVNEDSSIEYNITENGRYTIGVQLSEEGLYSISDTEEVVITEIMTSYEKTMLSNKIYSVGDMTLGFDPESDLAILCYNNTGAMSIWGENTGGDTIIYSLDGQTGQITFKGGVTSVFKVINYGNTLLNEDGVRIESSEGNIFEKYAPRKTDLTAEESPLYYDFTNGIYKNDDNNIYIRIEINKTKMIFTILDSTNPIGKIRAIIEYKDSDTTEWLAESGITVSQDGNLIYGGKTYTLINSF